MSREIALCITGTGTAAADFCAVLEVIFCSRSEWCTKFVFGQTVVLRSRARSHGGYEEWPSDRALSISVADRHCLNNLPRKIFSAFMKLGGNRCKDVEAPRFETDTHTYMNEIIYNNNNYYYY